MPDRASVLEGRLDHSVEHIPDKSHAEKDNRAAGNPPENFPQEFFGLVLAVFSAVADYPDAFSPQFCHGKNLYLQQEGNAG